MVPDKASAQNFGAARIRGFACAWAFHRTFEPETDMAYDKAAVRQVLDRVRADKRTALTAPEGKLICDAYGIPVPQEGVATSAAEAGKLAQQMGGPVVLKIVSPDILHKTEAGGVLVGVKTPRRRGQGLRHDPCQRQEVQGRRQDRRRAGAADAGRRAGGDRRCGHRRQLRQAGGVRPRRRAGRGAEGHHVPPRTGHAERCARRCSTASRPPRC